MTLRNIEDYETAERIFTENLMWLLDESVILHDARQIQIRGMLKRMPGVNKSNEDEFVSDTE